MKIGTIASLFVIFCCFSSCKFSNTIKKTSGDSASISNESTAANKWDATIIGRLMSSYVNDIAKNPNKKRGNPVFIKNHSTNQYQLVVDNK